MIKITRNGSSRFGFGALAFIGMTVSMLMFYSIVASRAGEPVDLELVLAIDSSTSVDSQEFLLQRHGLAEAFRHPDVIRAIIGAGSRGIAVSLIQWAGPDSRRVSVDWTRVFDQNSSWQLAAEIDAISRLVIGLTDISGAIGFSVRHMSANNYDGFRRVIDISGDGTGNAARSAVARDLALALGITINGLIIHSIEYDLGVLADIELRNYFNRHVIGGFGAFLMEARDFEDFQVAIKRKLIREISGPGIAKIKSDRHTDPG